MPSEPSSLEAFSSRFQQVLKAMSLSRKSSNKVSRQPPKIIHVIMRQHVPEQVANPLARGNISVNLLSPREDLLQRAVPQQITSNFTQRLAGIKNVAIRIHPWKHRRVALKVPEAQQCFDRSRGAVDRLNSSAPPFNDFVHQSLILSVFQQRQVRHFLHLRGLRRKNISSLPVPVQ